MQKTRRRFVQTFFLEVACVALLTVSGHAAGLVIHRVSPPRALRPLPTSVGGRIRLTASANAVGFASVNYTYQWPGTYFRAAFDGTRVYFRVVTGAQILHIVVDKLPRVQLVKPRAGLYVVEGLDKGKHTISVFVATESQAASNTFGGFAIPPEEKALRPSQRHFQIEFIGDSHTVGYGDLSNKHACTREEVWADTDNTKAFGPMTARHYNADYQINAISGRGVVRNYNGSRGDTLPQAYPYTLFDKKDKYNDPNWKPQVLVVALGTNDFSTPLNPGERWKTRGELHADFEATYLRFLEELRTRNPKAYIIVWATDMSDREIELEARKVVQQTKKRGERHITFLPIDGLTFTACNQHPSLADEKIIFDKVVHLIDADKQVKPK